MGNDGGSIPTRRELVKQAARLPTTTELKEAAVENLSHAWSFCPLSSAPLDRTNTVSDSRGRLYNYESIIQCLLPSSDMPIPETQEEAFKTAGIKSLKDVVKLKFAVRKDDEGREFTACPVSLKELGASTKSVYIVPCGHVFAEVALKEISGADATDEERRCPDCSEPFEAGNAIPILPTSEPDMTKLESRMEDLRARGLAHNLKKDKGSGKKKRKAEDRGNCDVENSTGKKEKREREKGLESRVNNSATASFTAKVLAEQEENIKRRKITEGRRGEAVR